MVYIYLLFYRYIKYWSIKYNEYQKLWIQYPKFKIWKLRFIIKITRVRCIIKHFFIKNKWTLEWNQKVKRINIIIKWFRKLKRTLNIWIKKY